MCVAHQIDGYSSVVLSNRLGLDEDITSILRVKMIWICFKKGGE